MPSTIADVARVAGVGRGTVSRVINDQTNVDPATRARVLEAIAHLDYVPSTVARRLSLGRTQTIAVVVPFLTTASVVARLRGIESGIAAAGLDMIVFAVETVERRDAVMRDLPRPERIDGLILVSLAPHDEEVARVKRSGLPTVLVDAHHPQLPRVVVDDLDGGRMAAQHLLDLGHLRIGFVGDTPQPGFGFTSSRLRQRGVDRALKVEGLAMPDSVIGLGAPTRERARDLAAAILTQHRPPTAIVAASDVQALGVLEAARDVGVEVPAELSVVGYDDIEAADYLGLTTIRQPLFQTGQRAVVRLLDIIEGRPAGPLREVMDVQLVVRRTTGLAPI